MKKLLLVTIASLIIALPQAEARWFDRVVVVVLENKDFNEAVHNRYLNKLAHQGSFLSESHGLFHPSYPNYLAMIGGRWFGTWFNKLKEVNAPHLGDLLEKKGYSWKNYAEGFPGDCFLGDTAGAYVRRHVPFLSFRNVVRDPRRCAKVVNADEFYRDWSKGELPHVSFYIPDNNHNGHDTGLEFASKWLEGFLEPMLADDSRMKGTLVVVTFDESESYFHNHIYTVFLGSMVKAGYISNEYYNHYDLLRTIEDNFELGTLDQGDEFGRAIGDVFK